MSNVTPGVVVTSTTPITAAILNLLGQPTVGVGAGEVTGTMMAANNVIPGFSLAANTKAILTSFTETFGATIAMTIDTAHGNQRIIPATSNTACTITPSSGGTSGEPLYLCFTTDGTGGNVITYAAPFKSIGTHTLTGANKKFTAVFMSDGTNFNEQSRTAALS